MTEAPATRVDPPALFTGFVVVLISVLFGLFLLGLHHLKVNLNLFPAAGTGLLLNVVFLGSLGLVLVMLAKFWLSWTFIETIQCFLITSNPWNTQFCPSRWPPTTPSSISRRTDVSTYMSVLSQLNQTLSMFFAVC